MAYPGFKKRGGGCIPGGLRGIRYGGGGVIPGKFLKTGLNLKAFVRAYISDLLYS